MRIVRDLQRSLEQALRERAQFKSGTDQYAYADRKVRNARAGLRMYNIQVERCSPD